MRAYEIPNWLDGRKLCRTNWVRGHCYWFFDTQAALWKDNNGSRILMLDELFEKNDWMEWHAAIPGTLAAQSHVPLAAIPQHPAVRGQMQAPPPVSSTAVGPAPSSQFSPRKVKVLPSLCEHEWIDTGFRRTWCRHCETEGEWDHGRVRMGKARPGASTP